MRRPHNLLGLDFRFLNNFKTVILILKQSSICLVQVQRRNLDTSSKLAHFACSLNQTVYTSLMITILVDLI